jgi:hypothetical protein
VSDDRAPSFLLYPTEDGRTRIELRLEGDTLWLTQVQMADVYQISVPAVNQHLKAIYAEGELTPEATIKSHLMVRPEGDRTVTRPVNHYDLRVVLAVGMRVRSHRGTQFRQWANARLNEYLVKGFAMDDERLKNPKGLGQTDYFDELLEKIRDIRASERRFYQKVLDIYATSVDYTPNTELSERFFATVQNKMHFAVHGRTAAELVADRADAAQPFMGLRTTRPGGVVRKGDVGVAKNYLDQDELDVLHRIVNAYIEFAELQAISRKPMTMRDWITKLDEFLKLTGRDLLHHAGTITTDESRAKAEAEYARWRAAEDARPRAVDAHFEAAAKQLVEAAKAKPRRRKPSGEGGAR